jgi:hypothetical protein
MIAVQDTGDPDTAGRALQVKHEVSAVTALAIPHLERRGAPGAERRVMVLDPIERRLGVADRFRGA